MDASCHEWGCSKWATLLFAQVQCDESGRHADKQPRGVIPFRYKRQAGRGRLTKGKITYLSKTLL